MSEQMTGYRVSFVDLFAPPVGDDGDRVHVEEIEIPVIQRDYAQGRQLGSVGEIRSAFLRSLRDALDGGPALSLDFVYGDVADGTFRPLDGQQRLTTLYLLHWYIAQRAGRDLSAEPWTRFSYATRHSSRRFVEELAGVTVPDRRDGPVSDWITDQAWFHYGWEHDPTIRSMLVMLDAIEETFSDLDPAAVWERLTSTDTPAVSFYVLPIEEMGQGDTLYIKMNSRGKPLTAFENFKALFERAVAATPHGEEIAHKIDGAWSDMMWPYRGDDNIVDDELLRYFTFLIEVCEWRAGATGTGRLIDRAERLFGGTSEAQQQALDFFVAALDTWVGVDADAYFGSLLRPPASVSSGDHRPTLFLPDNLDGLNLFALASANYGEMRNRRARAFPLNATVLLYAAILHRLGSTPEFDTRLRVLRNVVEASENEIRAERMHAILRDVDRYLTSEDGDLGALSSLNQTQVQDEQRKRDFLERHPECRVAVHALEDHRILRGALGAIDLDPTRIADRAVAFERMFSDQSTWMALTGVFLTQGDYFRRGWELPYRFGSPTSDARWRLLLTAPAVQPVAEIREAWSRMLDLVSSVEGDLVGAYEAETAKWLKGQVDSRTYDWRYHLVAYPEMREGESGLFVTENGSLGFEMCALRKTQLNSRYRDPYLQAIYERCGVKESLVPPVFSGYQYHPRWLRIRGAEVAVRCRDHGFDIRCEGMEHTILAALDGIAGKASVTGDGGVTWWAPQHEDTAVATDTVDRVQVGCEIVRRLVAETRADG